MINRAIRSFIGFVAVLCFCGVVFAISGVDLAFNAVPSMNAVPSRVVQADGKVLLWGESVVVSGVAKGRIARLNEDGTLDTGFTFCECGLDVLMNVAALPNGKILVAGSVSTLGVVVRLNNDGSLDPTFNFTLPASPNSNVTIVKVMSDGGFFATRDFHHMGFSGIDLYRFDPNGAQDQGFSGITIGSGTPNQSSLGAIEVLADERVYVAVNSVSFGGFSTNLRRYLSDGSTDPSWTQPNISGDSWTSIRSLALEADGDLIVSGNFRNVNGIAKTSLVRLKPAGNVDLDLATQFRFSGERVEVLTSGKILYSAVPANGDPGVMIERLNADGSIDETYEMAPKLGLVGANWEIDHLERVITDFGGRLGRLLPDGSLDASFSPLLGSYGTIRVIAYQPDGKVLMAGEFDRVNGIATPQFVRTNSDGTLDPTFDAGTGFSSTPSRIIVQPDGKLIVIGNFTEYNGVQKRGIVRLLPDGGIDTGFALVPGEQGFVRSAYLLDDGKLYIAGTFSEINGIPRSGVARINADGTLDAAFNVLIAGSPQVNAIVAQPDGKVIFGGSFSGVGGFNRSNLVRVDASGSLDVAFDPSSAAVGQVYLQDDGKVLTVPAFSSDEISITRRNADGTIDGGFESIEFGSGSSGQNVYIDSVLNRPDGTLIVVGSFRFVGSSARMGIARLRPDGELDQLFLPNAANGRVLTISDAGAGKILAGGEFTRIAGRTKAGNARIIVDEFRATTLYDFDGDGKADISVFRPSTNTWYILRSSDWTLSQHAFGSDGDIPVPADLDADGRTDPAIFRPSTGTWWYAASGSGGVHRGIQFGAAGDIPLPSDFDGDGRIDLVVYRQSNNNWYRLSYVGHATTFNFGLPDDIPVIGDFDHDGKADYAIFRPSTGDWWYAASSAGNTFRAVHWGMAGDIPLPADHDGDGKTDYAVYRPSEGGWYVFNSASQTATTLAFGLAADIPVVADYDGDGSSDIAVFRPETGIWYMLQSTSGFVAVGWGTEDDVPVPAAFVP